MILGIMRLHDFAESPYFEAAIDRLSEQCDMVTYLSHSAKEEICEYTVTKPNWHGITGYIGEWSQARTLDACMRLADQIKPEIVVLPDADEMLPAPDRLNPIIDEWRKVWDVRPTMSFRMLQAYGDMDHVLAENVAFVNWHCKIIRWRPGISYLDGYAGWCWPSQLYRQKKFRCPLPLLHLPYMTEAMRQKRLARREVTTRGQWAWWERPRKSMPYDPDMTYAEWERLVGPRVTREMDAKMGNPA